MYVSDSHCCLRLIGCSSGKENSRISSESTQLNRSQSPQNLLPTTGMSSQQRKYEVLLCPFHVIINVLNLYHPNGMHQEQIQTL